MREKDVWCPCVVMYIVAVVMGPCARRNAKNSGKIMLVEMLRPFRSSTPGTLARLPSRFRFVAILPYPPKKESSLWMSVASS